MLTVVVERDGLQTPHRINNIGFQRCPDDEPPALIGRPYSATRSPASVNSSMVASRSAFDRELDDHANDLHIHRRPRVGDHLPGARLGIADDEELDLERLVISEEESGVSRGVVRGDDHAGGASESKGELSRAPVEAEERSLGG